MKYVDQWNLKNKVHVKKKTIEQMNNSLLKLIWKQIQSNQNRKIKHTTTIINHWKIYVKDWKFEDFEKNYFGQMTMIFSMYFYHAVLKMIMQMTMIRLKKHLTERDFCQIIMICDWIKLQLMNNNEICELLNLFFICIEKFVFLKRIFVNWKFSEKFLTTLNSRFLKNH